MARCSNCNSLFFKTLETRQLGHHGVLLSKRRCKRCKFKCLFRQDLPDLQARPVSYELWLQARPLSRGDSRMRILASEYTRRISQSPEDVSTYVEQIERLQNQ